MLDLDKWITHATGMSHVIRWRSGVFYEEFYCPNTYDYYIYVTLSMIVGCKNFISILQLRDSIEHPYHTYHEANEALYKFYHEAERLLAADSDCVTAE